MQGVIFLTLTLLLSLPARAQLTYEVALENLPEELRSLEPVIRENLLAAAQAWASHVDAKPCSTEIVFRVDAAANAGRGSGRSLVTARLGRETHDGKLVSEQGWAAELRTGRDPNGADPDIEVILHPAYVRTIWWDPNPDKRHDSVPPGKLDSMSVLLHELGHALAFNGWIHPRTGELPGQFISSYDRHVKFDGQNFTFTGPETVKLWGRPVALARNVTNYHHVGDRPLDARDADLKTDLMNGVVLEHGRRYSIGLLDLAILYDCGIPLKPVKDTRPTAAAAAAAAAGAKPAAQRPDPQKDLEAQIKALGGAKPADRPALAEKVVQSHIDLADSLLEESRYPAALDALRRARGFTTQVTGPRAKQLATQIDVRTTLVQWRQANDGRGLRAEYFKDKDLQDKIAERIEPHVDSNWHAAVPVPGFDGNGFSARWSGYLVAPRPGIYVLAVNYDDDCRVFIDDLPLIEHWEGGGKQHAEAPIRLSGKPQPIRVEFRDRKGFARISLQWSLPDVREKVMAVIPPEAFFTDEKAAQRLAGKPFVPPRGFGLSAEYFEGDFVRPVLARVDPDVNFHWHAARPTDVGKRFSVRWTGFLRAPKPGKYHLIAHHDDGVRVYLGDKPLILRWNELGTDTIPVDLPAQPQPITIEYHNIDTPAYVSLQWQFQGPDPDPFPTIIPPSAFYTDLTTAQHAP